MLLPAIAPIFQGKRPPCGMALLKDVPTLNASLRWMAHMALPDRPEKCRLSVVGCKVLDLTGGTMAE
jgi:hypothetical protein